LDLAVNSSSLLIQFFDLTDLLIDETCEHIDSQVVSHDQKVGIHIALCLLFNVQDAILFLSGLAFWVWHSLEKLHLLNLAHENLVFILSWTSNFFLTFFLELALFWIRILIFRLLGVLNFWLNLASGIEVTCLEKREAWCKNRALLDLPKKVSKRIVSTWNS
jgi:hypothetical protein